eukprot:jgi/Undpi1/12611/HiC_scaffold_6.g02280.m1
MLFQRQRQRQHNATRRSTVFERKWELGLAWEMDLRHNGNSEGSTRCCLTSDLMRAATAEFLGTLLLLYNGITIARFVSESGTTESSASNLLISFGFGLSVLGLVYVMADVSGANFNPAVSVGLLLGKRISVERFFIYVIAQVLGGISGAGVAASALYGTDGGFNALAPGVEAVDAFGGEVLCTFLLVVTVFAATDGEMDRKQKHTGALLPLSIGMAVLLGNLVMIPLDGCSLNPARSMATAVTNNKWDDHWVFWLGPMLGGVLAALVWEAILRPAQPAQHAVQPEPKELLERTEHKDMLEACTAV